MRTIFALLLLSSFGLMVGCNIPKSAKAQESEPELSSGEVERFDAPAPTDNPAGSPSDSSPFDPLASIGGGEFSGVGPDPLTGESAEVQGLKSAAKKTEVWINYYYLRGNELSDREMHKLIGWAHQQGLTIGTPGEKDFLYTQVRLIDYVAYSEKIKRNLIYDGANRVYLPTLVFLDSQGRDLCHNVGQINMRHLQEDFDKFNRTPSGRKMGAESTGKDSLQVGNSEAGDWVCGPGGCRPRGRK